MGVRMSADFVCVTVLPTEDALCSWAGVAVGDLRRSMWLPVGRRSVSTLNDARRFPFLGAGVGPLVWYRHSVRLSQFRWLVFGQLDTMPSWRCWRLACFMSPGLIASVWDTYPGVGGTVVETVGSRMDRGLSLIVQVTVDTAYKYASI